MLLLLRAKPGHACIGCLSPRSASPTANQQRPHHRNRKRHLCRPLVRPPNHHRQLEPQPGRSHRQPAPKRPLAPLLPRIRLFTLPLLPPHRSGCPRAIPHQTPGRSATDGVWFGGEEAVVGLATTGRGCTQGCGKVFC